MGVFFKKGSSGFARVNGLLATTDLGTGVGTPAGNKFLTDDQTYTKVTAAKFDSTGATSGQVIKANGAGGAAWESV